MEMFNSASNVNVHGGEFSNVGRDYNHTVYNNTAVYTDPGAPLTKFLELLPGIDCESKHTAIKSVIRTQPSAGLWLLAHEAYTTWKAGQSSNRLLWLNGIPGAGKTVLWYAIWYNHAYSVL
ncbi:hypothetical protein M378DRAFT_169897 [Amanita muscaria Koide BX008]|uniref:Nephrocystin 3-like N-terminal domain-containing protein n=1 Tax=Amanita muscaria (strain Koide BX008) TaxID=946122 RepID=A0A0C2WCK8_AMAMK|nr:hypothetical protein M378DRAFT_169897 [Amanita muscaria Koide BX008]